MAIAFKAAGAGNGTETSGAALTANCPATVDANDILIAHVIHTGTTTAPSTPADWTLLAGPEDVGTTATARHWVFGKLATGSEDGASINFGTAGGTNGRAARIYSFSGYVSGTLAQVVPAASFSSIPHLTDPQGPTVTTTVAGALAVACMCQDDNNVEEAITGATGGTWGGHQEYSNATWGPQGIVLYLNVCTPTANPGTVSGGAIVAANDESGTIGFEIRPNAPEIVKAGSGVTALTSSGADAVTSAESGTGALSTVGAGPGDATLARAGSAVTGFTGSGFLVKEYPKQGAAESARVASGSDRTESSETGAAVSPFAASGADATANSETGSAAAVMVAAGTREQINECSGSAVSPRSAFGADSAEISRSGSSVSPRAASGTVAAERARAGTATSVLAASGARVVDLSRSGIGVAPFTASGPSQSGGDIIKIGTGFSPFTATGADVVATAETGLGVAAATASGSRSAERSRAGSAALVGAALGQGDLEAPRPGLAALVASASGADVSERSRPGAGVMHASGSGSKEGAASSKTGAGVLTAVASGEAIDYVVIRGPEATVSLRDKPSASVRKVSPL